MLHHRKDPRTVKKSYAYACVAKAEGSELLYFSPKCVDFERKKINGYVYKNGTWTIVESRFPDVIYNAGSPRKLANAKDIISRLRKSIPFTTNSIGNKMNVYSKLKNDTEFGKYFVPSKTINNSKEILPLITKYEKIVFKPVNGQKGRDIVYIDNSNDKFHLLIGEDNLYCNLDELLKFISSKLNIEPYLVQPYINCKTKMGFSYDFRLHVQKNGNKHWVITSIYPRISLDESIISNISRGGATNSLNSFLQKEFDKNADKTKDTLSNFALNLAKSIDNKQKKKLDELGIDVAFDEKGHLWIYEVNWRPGSPPGFNLDLDVAINMIRYAIKIAKK